MSQICRTCQQKGSKKCTGCKTVYYCSQVCQRKDWKEHQTFCRWSQVTSLKIPEDEQQEFHFVRSVGAVCMNWIETVALHNKNLEWMLRQTLRWFSEDHTFLMIECETSVIPKHEYITSLFEKMTGILCQEKKKIEYPMEKEGRKVAMRLSDLQEYTKDGKQEVILSFSRISEKTAQKVLSADNTSLTTPFDNPKRFPWILRTYRAFPPRTHIFSSSWLFNLDQFGFNEFFCSHHKQSDLRVLKRTVKLFMKAFYTKLENDKRTKLVENLSVGNYSEIPSSLNKFLQDPRSKLPSLTKRISNLEIQRTVTETVREVIEEWRREEPQSSLSLD